MNYIYVYSCFRFDFVIYTMVLQNSAIDFFEEHQAHVHNTQDKLEQVLVSQLRKVRKLQENQEENL